MDSPLTEMTVGSRKLVNISVEDASAYEFEIEQQGHKTEGELRAIVLNEFGMTDAEYNEIMEKTKNETMD